MPFAHAIDQRAARHDGEYSTLALLALVPDELHAGRRLLDRGEHVAPDVFDRLVAELRPLAARALPLEGALVRGLVDRETALARDDLREVDGKAEGVVQLEGGLAADDDRALRAQTGYLLVEDLQASLDGLPEPLFFAAGHAGDELLVALELRVFGRHQPDDFEGDLVQEEIADTEPVPVADRSAHHATEHVLAPRAVREDALGDEERGRSRVVGDDAHRHVVVALGSRVALAGDVAHLGHQRAQRVGVVVAGHPLQHARHALEARARVDARLREGHEFGVPRGSDRPLELHEDQVPQLGPAEAVRRWLLAEAAVGHAAARVAVEPVDLGARSARAGLAHLPEVVAGHAGHPDDALVAEAGHLAPDRPGVVVGGHALGAPEDRDEQAIFGKVVDLREELPRVGDGHFFEVVAEREVAEHLEERVVAGRDAHVLEVVVLAGDADDLLARGRARVRARLFPDEDVLELHHPGVDEHQRRIVLRDERRALNELVLAALEELEERAADLGGRTGHVRAAIARRRSSHRAATRSPSSAPRRAL